MVPRPLLQPARNLTTNEDLQKGFFIRRAKDIVRHSPSEPLLDVVADVKRAVKFAAAVVLGNKDELVNEVLQFIILRPWVPVLYVNTQDHITKRFLKYYENRGTLLAGFEVSSQALLFRVLGRNAKYSSPVAVPKCEDRQVDGEVPCSQELVQRPSNRALSRVSVADGSLCRRASYSRLGQLISCKGPNLQ